MKTSISEDILSQYLVADLNAWQLHELIVSSIRKAEKISEQEKRDIRANDQRNMDTYIR